VNKQARQHLRGEQLLVSNYPDTSEDVSAHR